MKTPKETAFELSLKYQKLLFVNISEENEDYIHEDSVKCAKICLQEIIKANPHSNPLNTQIESTMGYWQEVLNHLNEM